MKTSDFCTEILAVAKADSRYAAEAYAFLFETLEFASSVLGSRGRHITAVEMLDGFRVLAVMQFGPLARTVTGVWGVNSTRDVGHMVFNLVEAGMMGKTSEDRIEDFLDVYDFDETFDFDRIMRILSLRINN